MITYCCKDCGGLITSMSALYGQGRCYVCANLGKNNPRFGKKGLCGKNNPNYKHGLTRKYKNCVDCGTPIQNKFAKRCTLCCKQGVNHPRLGKKHSIETKLKISNSRIGKCCGKENSSWINGISQTGYPHIFNNNLKLKIRQRDNYKCNCCELKEENHYRGNKKLNLTIHHVDYNKKNCKEDNLISLCYKCNIKANFNRDYWYAYYTYLMESK
jgi:hypothetical protein